MAIITWGGHKLDVSAKQILSPSSIDIQIEAETEDKETSGRTYKAFKGTRGRVIHLDLPLFAALGTDVRAEADAWLDDCAKGRRDKFYIAEKPVSDKVFLLTSAQAAEIAMLPGGGWKQATLKLEFSESGSGTPGSGVQSGGSSGGSSGGKGSSGGSSKKKKKPSSSGSKAPPNSGLIGSVAAQMAAKKQKDYEKAIAKRARDAAAKKSKYKGAGGGGSRLSYIAMR